MALLAIAAGWLSRLWVTFDLFNFFLLQFLAIAVACLTGFVMPRARLLSAAVVLLAALAAIGLWPQAANRYATGGEPRQPGGLKIMSFNSYKHNDGVEAIAAAVRRHDPDLLALVEITSRQRALLELLRKDYPYQIDCSHQLTCRIAVLSKRPMTAREARPRRRTPGLVRVTLKVGGQSLTVIATHTVRLPYLREQLRQMHALADYTRRFPGPKVIVGDFNATPFSRMLDTFVRHSRLRRVTNLPTFPTRWLPLPQLAIDHVFLSPEVDLLSPVRIGDNAGSDHAPLIAEIAIAK